MPGLCLLDSSVWVHVLRRLPHPAVQARVQALLQTEIVATSGQIILELLGGTVTKTEYQRLEARLLGLRYLAVTKDDWPAAARLTFALRRAGLTVPVADTLLAAVAIRTGATLVHIDQHFDAIARHTRGALQVESLLSLVR